MTTPGGVPNLPHGALTLDTLASKLQDMSGTAMKNRAVERFPSIFNSSTGLDPSLDITPFGILTRIWAEVNSLVANADPADIQSPEDLPELVLEFIEGLPVIGQFVGLLEAILGTYTGDDEALLTVQEIFAPIRALVAAVEAVAGGGFEDFFQQLLGADSPLNLRNAFGLLRPGNIPEIGTGQIGSTIQNLVDDPDFLSFTGSGDFLPDLIRGGVKVIADGAGAKDLLLEDPIRVSPKQKLPLSVQTAWDAVTATGLPIRLGVTTYTYDEDTDTYTAAGEADVVSQGISPATSDWRTLSGTYVVPNSGVDAVRPRLTLTPQATAGTVHFKKVSVTKTGALRIALLADDDGNGLPDILEGHGTDIASLFTGLGGKASSADLASLLSTLGGGFGSNLAAVAARLADMLHSSSTLDASNIGAGSLSETYFPAHSSMRDNFVTRFLNLGGSGFNDTDLTAAISAHTEALTGLGAQMSQLQTIYTSGVSDGDDFERTGSTLGSGWLVSYSSGAGTVGTPNGHDASWQTSGIGARDFLAIRDTPGLVRSATNSQRVTVALASRAGSFFGANGYNDVWLRISDDTTSIANVTGIRIRFGADGSVQIHRFINGVGVLLNGGAAGTVTPPAAGAVIGGEAGTPGTARYFRPLLNNNGIIPITEVGTASGVGATYTRWGLGGRAEGTLLPLPTQQGMGAVRQWNGMDQ